MQTWQLCHQKMQWWQIILATLFFMLILSIPVMSLVGLIANENAEACAETPKVEIIEDVEVLEQEEFNTQAREDLEVQKQEEIENRNDSDSILIYAEDVFEDDCSSYAPKPNEEAFECPKEIELPFIYF